MQIRKHEKLTPCLIKRANFAGMLSFSAIFIITHSRPQPIAHNEPKSIPSALNS